MSKRSADKKRRFGLRILISLFLFVCLVIFSSAVMLKKGIRFDSFTIGRTTLSDFSLQWQDRLKLQIDTVTVSEQQHEEKSPVDLSLIGKGINGVQRWGRLFSEISINVIKVGELTATIHFDQNADQNPCFFTLTSKDLTFRSNLAIDQNTLVITITEAISKQFNSRAFGQIRLNGEKEQITGSLTANLGGTLPVALDFTADQEQISFQGKGTKSVNTITPFVDLFGLDPTIQRWITDFLQGSSYTLKTFSGLLPWKTPATLLDTFFAEARVDKTEYTFCQGLEPVTADYTDVTFSKGVLNILPHGASFYGQKIDKDSRVDINFNDPANILLTVSIKALATANDDILTLLKAYNIALPFKQTAGKTAAELSLDVNLNTDQVTSQGTFLIDEGVIEYDHKNYRLTDVRVSLENSDVTIEHGRIRFEELFVANVTGTLKAASGSGELIFTLEQLAFNTKRSRFTLNKKAPRPTIRYHIRPDAHSVDVAASSWNLDALQLDLGPFSTPFSLTTLSGILPPTLLTIGPDISGTISGSFSIKEKNIDLHSELLTFQRKDITLEEANVPISIKYDQGLTIRNQKTSHWKLNNIATTLYPTEFKYAHNLLTMTNGRVGYGDFFDSRVSGHYNTLSQEGGFLLEDLHIKKKNMGSLLGSDTAIPIEVSGKNHRLTIKVSELALLISTEKDKSWSAHFQDLAAIHRHSALLQQYQLDAGSLKISSKNGKMPYTFSADIPYRYSFLVKDNTAVDRLQISGEITSQGFTAEVNKDLHIRYSDRLRITSEDLAFNIPGILKFLKNRPSTRPHGSQKKKMVPVTLEASNSALFFKPGNQVLADTMDVTSIDGKTSMRLEHGPGNLLLDIEAGTFSLQGQELNDTFMNGLVQGVHFQNGKMSVVANGSFDKFSTLFKIKDTVLTEFTALHNILAVIDTIPALITFSLPEYNSEGLPVSSAIVGMKIDEGKADLESFTIESSEIHLTGSGWINFPENLIEMDLNLITQAKANLTKIPLIGYVLVGKEKHPSVTFHVSGDLQNPEVENSIFREVATLPFALLYRTLTLPSHLLDSMSDSPEDEHNAENNPNAGEIDEKKSTSPEAVYRE